MLHDVKSVLGVELSPENEELLAALGIVPADRAERLLAGTMRGERPAEWSAELVKTRLSSAAEILERTGRRIGPNLYGRSWIDWRAFRDVDAFDRNCMAEGLREGTRDPGRSRVWVSAADIKRADEALLWPMRYLAGQDDLREVLSVWIWCQARHQSFSHWFRTVANCRGTANRKRDRAFAIIAAGLTRDRVTPE